MDAEQRARMGTKGREKILEKYSCRDTVRQTTNVYRELLDGADQATPQPVAHQ